MTLNRDGVRKVVGCSEGKWDLQGLILGCKFCVCCVCVFVCVCVCVCLGWCAGYGCLAFVTAAAFALWLSGKYSWVKGGAQ